MIGDAQAHWRRWDAIAVTLWVVLLPLQLDVGLPFRLAPSDFVLAVWLLASLRRLRFSRPPWSLWHLALVLVFLMGAVVAYVRTGQLTPYAIWQKGVGLLVLLAAYAMVTTAVGDWAAVRRVLRAFVLSTAGANLVAGVVYLVCRVQGTPLPWSTAVPLRFAGFLIDPNALGSLLVVALAILLLTWRSPKPLVGGFPGGVCVLTLGSGLLLTLSRSAWLGALVVLPAAAMLAPGSLTLLALSGVIAVLGVRAMMRGEYVSFIVAQAMRVSPIQQRLDIIREALESASQSPLVGTGLGVFLASSTRGLIVHNTLLWSLTEFGAIGLVVFTGFLAWLTIAGVRTWRGAPRDERAVAAAVTVAHLAMIAVSMGIEALYQRHWWMVMALIAASRCLAEAGLPGGSGEACRTTGSGPLQDGTGRVDREGYQGGEGALCRVPGPLRVQVEPENPRGGSWVLIIE